MKNKKNPIQLFSDHPKPVSRRQLLASGLHSLFGYIAAPSIIDLLMKSPEALAALNCTPTGIDLPAFVTLDLAGGSALTSHVCVGTAGPKDFFTDRTLYQRLGVMTDPAQSTGGIPNINETFGLPFHQNLRTNINFSNTVNDQTNEDNATSGNKAPFLAGILSALNPSDLPKVKMGSFCCFANDDNTENTINPIKLMVAAGRYGRLLKILGTRSSVTGGNSSGIGPVLGNAIQITSGTSINSVLGFGPDINNLPVNVKSRMIASLRNMSVGQSNQLAHLALTQASTDSLACIYGQTLPARVQTVPNYAAKDDVNPLLDGSTYRSIWGNGASIPDGEFSTIATMMKTVLEDNSPAATVSLGGYDYHYSQRYCGDAADYRAGVVLGKMIRTAIAKGKKMAIAVISDGSCYSNDADHRVQTGDSGVNNIALMVAVDPNGSNGFFQYNGQPNIQIGKFGNSSGQIDQSDIFGSATQASIAMLWNYLVFAGRPDLFDSTLAQLGLSMSVATRQKGQIFTG